MCQDSFGRVPNSQLGQLLHHYNRLDTGCRIRLSEIRSASMRSSWVYVLIIGIFASCGGKAFGSSDGKATVSLTIRAVEDSLKTGSPVRIRVTLKNQSDHDISVTREVRGRECKVDVRDENGKLAADTSTGYAWNGHVPNLDLSRITPADLKGALVFGTLKTGETTAWVMDVGTLYVMTKPGKYKIQLERTDPENASVTVKSNVVTVTVTR